MTIQWFPGHMHKTRKALMLSIKDTDVVIELLDARLPLSSANPLLKAIGAQKPSLKILNKQDLADPKRTAMWLDYYQQANNQQVVIYNAKKPLSAKWLMGLCRQLAPYRGQADKPMRAMIWGIPNVGKSTFINGIGGRSVAKTGNEAGITKQERRIVLSDNFWLLDTPGMLWPRIQIEENGMNLAASGAIGKNAFDEVTVAYYLLSYLTVNYPQALPIRYDVSLESTYLPCEVLLEAIARRCGALLNGHTINYHKVANIILTDFRSGVMGSITLETPSQWIAWQNTANSKDSMHKKVMHKPPKLTIN